MAKRKSTEITAAPQGGLPADYEAFLADQIRLSKEMQSKLPTGGAIKSISLSASGITVAGEKMGLAYDMVIAAYTNVRTYYRNAYTAGSKDVPICYSFDLVRPHEKASEPQCETCADCPKNAFGSASNGKGKACSEGFRFAGIAPGQVKAAGLAEAELITGHPSTLNARHWSDYLTSLGNKGLHFFQVVTRLVIGPDPKSQYRLTYEMRAPLTIPPKSSGDFMTLIDRASKSLRQPYPPPRAEEEPKKTSLRKSRMGA